MTKAVALSVNFVDKSLVYYHIDNINLFLAPFWRNYGILIGTTYMYAQGAPMDNGRVYHNELTLFIYNLLLALDECS